MKIAATLPLAMIVFAAQAIAADPAAEPVGQIPLLATLNGHKAQVQHVCFSPDGKILASASDDHAVKLWDVASRKEVAALEGHTGSVCAVGFSPDGKQLASGGAGGGDGAARIWDVASGQLQVTLRPDVGSIHEIVFLPRGNRLLVAGAGRIEIWDWASAVREQVPVRNEWQGPIGAVAVSPDGRLLAIGNRLHVLIWDLESKELRAQIRPLPEGVEKPNSLHSVVALTFSRNNSALASAYGLKIDSTITLWDVRGANPLAWATLDAKAGSVSALAFSPDGKFLAAAGKGLSLWDAASGRQIANSGDEGRLRLRDIFDGDYPFKEEIYVEDYFPNTVSYSPDGKLLASGGFDGKVRLWDATSPIRNQR